MVYAASDPEVSEGVCKAGYQEEMHELRLG